MRIEAMMVSDVDEVIQLCRAIPALGFSAGFDTPQRLMRFILRNEGCSTVARMQEEIVGALLCGHDGRRGFIYHTGVKQAYRRKGIAGSMVQRSLQALKEQGIDSCFLFTHAVNQDAQAFWMAQGFEYAPHVMYHSRGI